MFEHNWLNETNFMQKFVEFNVIALAVFISLAVVLIFQAKY